MNLALDASAMIALLKNEPGAQVVEDLLRDRSNRCFAHAVNLCEVYYDFLLRGGEEVAEGALSTLAGLRIVFFEETGKDIWREAARNKACLKLPLGDCFLLAMASRIGGQAVSADRLDLEPLQGELSIRFIR